MGVALLIARLGLLAVFVVSGVAKLLDLSGSWELACHLPDSQSGKAFDHYDIGMKTLLAVTP